MLQMIQTCWIHQTCKNYKRFKKLIKKTMNDEYRNQLRSITDWTDFELKVHTHRHTDSTLDVRSSLSHTVLTGSFPSQFGSDVSSRSNVVIRSTLIWSQPVTNIFLCGVLRMWRWTQDLVCPQGAPNSHTYLKAVALSRPDTSRLLIDEPINNH